MQIIHVIGKQEYEEIIMNCRAIKPPKKYSVDRKYFIIWCIFILFYVVGIIIPLEATPHYYNVQSRVWNWTEILLLLLAVYYIIRTRSFQWKQAVMALLLGAVCLFSLFRDPRTVDIIVTSVCVTVTFYAACRLYEMADMENVSIHIGIVKSLRYFGLGAVISIPLAVLNVIYYSLSRQINMRNVLSSAVFALKPAIAEEVVFRFFLLSYAYYLFYGKEETRFKNVLIYILLIIPHEVLHYPDLFIESPGLAVAMCIVGGVLFNLPMALLMKKKNLQMAIGMHWFIDFARFAAGF